MSPPPRRLDEDGRNGSGRKRTIVEELTRQLSQDIADGLLAPGVWLDEKGVAERFGVSRTPVREALGQLVALGLGDRRPHRGVVVAAVTVERLHQMFEVMTELEGTCARFAAIRMTKAERRDLVGLHEASAEAAALEDVAAYTAFNRRFHQLIYAGGHNFFLVETTQDVRRRLAPFRNAQFKLEGRPSASHVEHRAVVDAIVARDGEAARAAMVNHIARVRDAYRAFVAGGSRRSGAEPARALTVPDL